MWNSVNYVYYNAQIVILINNYHKLTEIMNINESTECLVTTRNSTKTGYLEKVLLDKTIYSL